MTMISWVNHFIKTLAIYQWTNQKCVSYCNICTIQLLVIARVLVDCYIINNAVWRKDLKFGERQPPYSPLSLQLNLSHVPTWHIHYYV